MREVWAEAGAAAEERDSADGAVAAGDGASGNRCCGVGGAAVKKPKQHCANCGDETTFRESDDYRRVLSGWCPRCFKKAASFIRFEKQIPGGPDGVWVGEDRTLYGRRARY